MEDIGKDILGLIVLKLEMKDVLNLRLTCRKLNEIIINFNKYWFVKSFEYNYPYCEKFLRHFNHTHWDASYKFSFKAPYIQCVSPSYIPEELNLIDEEVLKHPLYKEWVNKWKSITKNRSFPETYKKGYIRGKYLKNKYPDFKCPNKEHYTHKLKKSWLKMNNINVINENIVEFYDHEKKYFKIYVIEMFGYGNDESEVDESIKRRLRKIENEEETIKSLKENLAERERQLVIVKNFLPEMEKFKKYLKE